MPHIQINKNEFNDLVGAKVTDKTLNEDASFLGVHWNHVNEEKWDIEVYPNRPDLLSVEGLARAYKGYFDQETGLREFEVNVPESQEDNDEEGGSGSNKGVVKVEKEDSVDDVRPYIGCAVVRNVELNEKMINGLIQLQEKLHVSYGRRRDKLAIGLHDMSEINPPFTYKAVAPGDESFTPLDHDEEIDLAEILARHEKGQKYSWILEDEDQYPIIVDSNGSVLSFPPIINNQLTEVDQGTENIFIDVTGKHKETVEKALNIIVATLDERGGEIEAVDVDGQIMPDLDPEVIELNVDYVNSVSGLDLSPDEVKDRLEKMRYGVDIRENLKVKVPAYRTDVMHQYDLIEDIVIAHGYNNIDPVMPEVDQDGGLTSISRFSDEVRDTLLRSGAIEANTYVLTNEKALFEKMELDKSEDQVDLENPMTREYSTVRSWLTPSLFQVLEENKHNSYPQRFFEVEDVVEKTDNYKGSENVKKLAYLAAGDIDYNDARKKLQSLERDLGIDLKLQKDYQPFHKHARSANILFEGEQIGFIGEFSETVRNNWELETPVAGFELNVEKLKEKI